MEAALAMNIKTLFRNISLLLCFYLSELLIGCSSLANASRIPSGKAGEIQRSQCPFGFAHADAGPARSAFAGFPAVVFSAAFPSGKTLP
ncbi:MAG TPA: hypothetical protein VMH28_10270 [Candidatus Acidoferrales bacterium]|nr:hypothetical protein [Candidatus Acidoferrales bacterium]